MLVRASFVSFTSLQLRSHAAKRRARQPEPIFPEGISSILFAIFGVPSPTPVAGGCEFRGHYWCWKKATARLPHQYPTIDPSHEIQHGFLIFFLPTVPDEASTSLPPKGDFERMARRKHQNPKPVWRGKWWTLRVWKDTFTNGQLKRVRKRIRLAPAQHER